MLLCRHHWDVWQKESEFQDGEYWIGGLCTIFCWTNVCSTASLLNKQHFCLTLCPCYLCADTTVRFRKLLVALGFKQIVNSCLFHLYSMFCSFMCSSHPNLILTASQYGLLQSCNKPYTSTKFGKLFCMGGSKTLWSKIFIFYKLWLWMINHYHFCHSLVQKRREQCVWIGEL